MDFPNVYLHEVYYAQVRDAKGARFRVATKVMRPRVPYYVIVSHGNEVDSLLIHDYCLIFPEDREKLFLRGAIRLKIILLLKTEERISLKRDISEQETWSSTNWFTGCFRFSVNHSTGFKGRDRMIPKLLQSRLNTCCEFAFHLEQINKKKQNEGSGLDAQESRTIGN